MRRRLGRPKYMNMCQPRPPSDVAQRTHRPHAHARHGRAKAAPNSDHELPRMCICTYVCMNVCMYVYVYIYIHMYIHNVYIYVYTHMYVHMYIMYMYIVYTCTYMYTHVCVYIYIYTHVYTCTCIHTGFSQGLLLKERLLESNGRWNR